MAAIALTSSARQWHVYAQTDPLQQSNRSTSHDDFTASSAHTATTAAGVTTDQSPFIHVPNDPRLQQRLNISVDNADLASVVKALQKEAGMVILVDSTIPATRKYTLQTHNIPLGKILESVATQAGVMISSEGGTIVLEPYPNMTINGKTSSFPPRNAPWNDTWGGTRNENSSTFAVPDTSVTPPQIAAAPGNRTLPQQGIDIPAAISPAQVISLGPVSSDAISQLSAVVSAAQPQIPFAGIASTPPGAASPMVVLPTISAQRPTPIVITALSEKTFLVTEAAIGPGKAPGFYITVYHITGSPALKAGEKLEAGPRTFHKSAPGSITVGSLASPEIHFDLLEPKPVAGISTPVSPTIATPAAPARGEATPTVTAPAAGLPSAPTPVGTAPR